MSDGISRLCAALHAVGIDCVFGVPGTQNVMLFEGFRRSRMRTVLASHELAASFMANGHFRATGRVAVLATIPGPGFTYALTGLAEARLDSVGIIYLVGKPADAPGRRFWLQSIDQRAIAAPLLKATFSLGAADDVERVIRDAFAEATEGEPGPVMIELDLPALEGSEANAGLARNVSRPTAAPQAGITKLSELFADSARPLLFLGQGAFASATRLGGLSKRLGIPVVTTPTARGILSEDEELAMGFDPLRGNTDVMNRLLDRADLVVALGCKLGHNGSAGFELIIPSDRFVHVDAEPGTAGANYDAVLALTARVEEVVPALEARQVPASWPPAELREMRTAMRQMSERRVEPVIQGRGTLTAAEFFTWFRATLPPDAIVVTGSGMHQVLARRYFDVRSPRGLIVPSDFQSMGFGLPAAIGAKLAVGDRAVVAVVGDGGFMMSGMELLTARREAIPIVTFVFNDGQLNQIRLQQFADYGRAHAVKLLNPDFRGLASAFGISYVRYGEDAPGEIASLLHGDRPAIVEVMIGDSAAIRALPVVARAKELARQSLGTDLHGWFKKRLRRR